MGVLRSAAHRRAESRSWGVFIIAVHRAFVLGLGARHRGIVELGQRIDGLFHEWCGQNADKAIT